MATSNKSKQANAAVEAHSALTNRMAALTAVLETQAALISQFMAAQGFWESDNTGEKVALTHSEPSEALEAENVPGFTDVEEELADAVISILDFAGHHNPRFGEALSVKIADNLTRPVKPGKAY